MAPDVFPTAAKEANKAMIKRYAVIDSEKVGLRVEVAQYKKALAEAEAYGKDLKGQLDVVRGQRDDAEARLAAMDRDDRDCIEKLNARLAAVTKQHLIDAERIERQGARLAGLEGAKDKLVKAEARLAAATEREKILIEKFDESVEKTVATLTAQLRDRLAAACLLRIDGICTAPDRIASLDGTITILRQQLQSAEARLAAAEKARDPSLFWRPETYQDLVKKQGDTIREQKDRIASLVASLAAACPKDCPRHACIGSEATRGEPRGPCDYKRRRG
jgi:chromosome segregation ATPase